MPIPKPTGSETEDEYMKRCMADSTMVTEYGKNQRTAVCLATYKGKGENMDFTWKIIKGKKNQFEDKVHNLACFEVVLNIMRMKINSNEDVSEEMQALCGFALECMFGDTDLTNDDVFNSIMDMKDKKVHKFRNKLLKDMGVPKDVMDAPAIGEA